MLSGRVLVITGATGGLGPVVAAQAAAAGASLVLCGNDEGRLAAMATELGARGGHSVGDQAVGQHSGEVLTATVDLSDPDAVAWLAHTATAWRGHVDAVLHLVGGWRGGQPLTEAPAEDWPWLLERVVTTTINAIRAFAEPLKAAPNGRFLTVSSPQATSPTSSNAAYGAAKAASDAWTLALADDFAASRATANIIVVPAIATPQMRAERPAESFSTSVDAETIADAMLALCAETAPSANGQRLPLATRGGA